VKWPRDSRQGKKKRVKDGRQIMHKCIATVADVHRPHCGVAERCEGLPDQGGGE